MSNPQDPKSFSTNSTITNSPFFHQPCGTQNALSHTSLVRRNTLGSSSSETRECVASRTDLARSRIQSRSSKPCTMNPEATREPLSWGVEKRLGGRWVRSPEEPLQKNLCFIILVGTNGRFDGRTLKNPYTSVDRRSIAVSPVCQTLMASRSLIVA